MESYRFTAYIFRTNQARRARLNEAAFTTHLSSVDFALLALSPLWKVASEANVLQITHVTQFIRSLTLLVCFHAFLGPWIIQERLDRRWQARGAGSESWEDRDDEEYWARVSELGDLAKRHGFSAARQFVAVLRLPGGSELGGRNGIGSIHYCGLDAQAIVFNDVPSWAAFLVDTPAFEQGGPAGFSFDTKIADLETLIDNLRSTMFYQARTKYIEATTWLVEQLEAVKQQRDALQK
ncbi:Zn(2)-C7 fungal-type transcription factor [Pseudohyphozyma bogoriensis]|nr:Zn(2)-C7 fungal-type transcription factor [Pseudohyphozyma bogoriensis]